MLAATFPSKLVSPSVVRLKAYRAVPCKISLSASLALDEYRTQAFWDYQFLFASQRNEPVEAVDLKVVEGQIPPDFPSGTYYLAGPGIISDDYGSTLHPFDGHGYIRAFNISAGIKGANYVARYVKTEALGEEYDPETDTWRFTRRGPFSVLKGAKMLGNSKVMRNVANTNVVSWGGRLLCMWEGGCPYEIHPQTLDTIGEVRRINGCDFSIDVPCDARDISDVAGMLLKPILRGGLKMPSRRLLSHCKIDARNNRLLMMACMAEDFLLPRNTFTFYEFDSEFNLLQTKEFSIADHLLVHDWAFTDSHYILLANRVKLDFMGSIKAILGISPMISALQVNNSEPNTPIYLLPRFVQNSTKDGDWRRPIKVPTQLWLLHIGNSFQQINENEEAEIHIQASACSYEWFNFQKMFGYNWRSGRLDPSAMNEKIGKEKLLPHLVQFSIYLDAHGRSRRCYVKPLAHCTTSSDFPSINPRYFGRKNSYVYAAIASGSRPTLPHFPFDTIVKFNIMNRSTRSWPPTPRRFVGEPIFIPVGIEEDDGYLITVEYAVSIQRNYLLILDARRIGHADAFVARLEIPRSLTFPLGFHGFWASNQTA